jgi:dTDP-4-amino-4,6-dideoxygalactose transaminase
MLDMTRPIPQCSPLAAYHAQASDIDAAIRTTLENGRYILGPRVRVFEGNFARWVGTQFGLGVANGTDSLGMALRALGVGDGDAVVTTSMTAVATAVAIRSTGAIPVFADVDDDHGLLDPEQVARLFPMMGGRIKAIVPVHLYGRCADMTGLCSIARDQDVSIVEDCAQAHGARWQGRAAGTFGAFGCFSFYPTKNLGAIGDGGALVTDDANLLERARLLREYGWQTRYVSDIEGGNSRLDELQAAILDVKLTRLDADNAARRNIAARYRDGIDNPHVRIFRGNDDGHVYHQFVIRTADREGLQAHLSERGIGSLVHYPVAVHAQPAYSNATYQPLPLRHTQAWASTVLSLPMFPQLPMEDVGRVIEAVNTWPGPR